MLLSGEGRRVEAVFVPTVLPPRAALLLLHGIGDRLSFWQEAQTLLKEAGVASLIAHYSGYGATEGCVTAAGLSADAHAAYTHLLGLVPVQVPVFVLGFSLGTGVLGAAANDLVPPPAGLILCQPFSSLRDAAATMARSRLLACILPDIWRTTETLRVLPCPLLLVHTDADRLFPAAMARRIAAAAASSLYPVTLATPAGRGHTDVYLHPRDGYWAPILAFIENHGKPVPG